MVDPKRVNGNGDRARSNLDEDILSISRSSV